MKRLAVFVFPFLLAAQSASADPATASGSVALALAAIVAGYSPVLPANEKAVMAKLFAANLKFAYSATKKITVKADAVTCRASNVDLTSRSCELTFGTKKHTITGRAAHELYATAVEAGVASDGAAGTIFENFSHLDCTIDPHGIKEKDGGGADCKFDTGT